GLVRCGGCGAALSPVSARKGGRLYRYYRCVRRDKGGRAACGARAAPAAALEAFVRERLRAFALDVALVARVRDAFAARLGEAREALERERAPLAVEVARLAAEAEPLLAGFGASEKRVQGLLASRLDAVAAELETRLDAVAAELETRRTRLATVERGLARVAEAEKDGVWVLNTLADPDALWDTLTPANARRLLGALLDRVVVDTNGGHAELVLALGGLVPSPAALAPAPVDATRRVTADPGAEGRAREGPALEGLALESAALDGLAGGGAP
nr:zinc ribbon domain-containing protein [Polyangiaceae bacterium]